MTRYELKRELEQILSEPISSVVERSRTALDELLQDAGGRVVLVGAGSLGTQAVACLRTIGVEPAAFTDSNPALWGTSSTGIPVLSPDDAAVRFGSNALFIVTIWNPFHWYQETLQRLTALGCTRVTPPSPLYWRFASTFLPFCAQDVPENVYTHADQVLRCADRWSDAPSRLEYLEQIAWRARGTWTGRRPSGDETVSYFLPQVFQLTADEVFVDCGAFDGDTLSTFLSRCDGMFRHFVAMEPDPTSFSRLDTYVGSLPIDVQERISTVNCAVGSARSTLSFTGTGDVAPKSSRDRAFVVPCLPISELSVPAVPITFIKMDIEGAELDALRGAIPVIERDRPILSVCVYHNQNDIWSLPLFIGELLPHHEMFLRCHEGDGWQTVAYAIPPDRVLTGQHR